MDRGFSDGCKRSLQIIIAINHEMFYHPSKSPDSSSFCAVILSACNNEEDPQPRKFRGAKSSWSTVRALANWSSRPMLTGRFPGFLRGSMYRSSPGTGDAVVTITLTNINNSDEDRTCELLISGSAGEQRVRVVNPAIYLRTDRETYEIYEGTGEHIVITICSSTDWALQASEEVTSWCAFSKESGSGDDEIELIVKGDRAQSTGIDSTGDRLWQQQDPHDPIVVLSGQFRALSTGIVGSDRPIDAGCGRDRFHMAKFRGCGRGCCILSSHLLLDAALLRRDTRSRI